mmetsp:Transcript_7814/g.11841  ORF Transcript_7814/g.11841 Transcript_7814/m.11841 type:complete len:570 (+) Transcript_7814:214-1923(+)
MDTKTLTERRGDSRIVPIRDGHDEWYKREVERGRRFHGAFSGGHSAGYYNTVGSAAGWQPTTFSSSRGARQKITKKSAADYADEEDGLIGASLHISKAYDDANQNKQNDDLSVLLNFDDRLEGTRARRMLRLLSRRQMYLSGEKVQFTPMPKIAVKSDRFCLGYQGFVQSLSTQRGQKQITHDEDDVYENEVETTYHQYLMDKEEIDIFDDDDSRKRRKSKLLIEAAPSHHLRAGEPLPGFVRYKFPKSQAVSFAELPSPPRHWQQRHIFDDDSIKHITPLSFAVWRRPTHQIVKQVRQDQATPVAALAVNDRFRSAGENHDESALSIRPGLHFSKKIIFNKLPLENKNLDQKKTETPETWQLEPRRTTISWRPLPLLCKRFALPIPVISQDASSERANNRPRLDRTVDIYRKHQEKSEQPIIQEEQAVQLLDPPARPEIDIFKAIFDQVQDVEEEQNNNSGILPTNDHEFETITSKPSQHTANTSLYIDQNKYHEQKRKADDGSEKDDRRHRTSKKRKYDDDYHRHRRRRRPSFSESPQMMNEEERDRDRHRRRRKKHSKRSGNNNNN